MRLIISSLATLAQVNFMWALGFQILAYVADCSISVSVIATFFLHCIPFHFSSM
jgi:hypothetical protein